MTLEIPEDAALDLLEAGKIAKIPGGGKSVTVDVMNSHRMTMGGPTVSVVFDVTVAGRTDSGDPVSQNIFLDLNG